MSSLVRSAVVRRRDEIRRAFTSDTPLPQFVVVPRFLSESIAEDVAGICQSAPYSTYCAYTPAPDSGAVYAGFCEPDEQNYYVTIHERPRMAVAQLELLESAFDAPELIMLLAELTGIDVTRLVRPAVVSCWGAGSFFEPHTDHDPHRGVRLVVSLSLTTDWKQVYGGTTVYAWRGGDAVVRVKPRFNQAVLFAPSPRSVHWVEQIAACAPGHRRFTWTASFA